MGFTTTRPTVKSNRKTYGGTMSIDNINTVGDLIEALKKYPADTQIVCGDGSNGYYDLYVSTVKEQISEECIIEYCAEWEVTPDTVTISEDC